MGFKTLVGKYPDLTARLAELDKLIREQRERVDFMRQMGYSSAFRRRTRIRRVAISWLRSNDLDLEHLPRAVEASRALGFAESRSVSSAAG